MSFRITISDPKERKAYQLEKDAPELIGMKLGQSFDGSAVGLSGYRLKITGGSDKDGFPMRGDLDGIGRRRLVLARGPGYRPPEKGVRKMKSIRGNTVSTDTAQINTVIEEREDGARPVAEVISWVPKPKEEKKKEAPKEEKKEKK